MGYGSPPPPPRRMWRRRVWRRPRVIIPPLPPFHLRPRPPSWYFRYPGRMVWHGGRWVWRRIHPRRGYRYYRRGGRWFRRRWRNRRRLWRHAERIGDAHGEQDDGADDYDGQEEALDAADEKTFESEAAETQKNEYEYEYSGQSISVFRNADC